MTYIINVKDYGAVGNDLVDDGPAIQSAIDAAFGSAGSPNGTYAVASPLILTRVRGAHIYGAGQESTKIKATSASVAVVQTNGLEYCCFEDMSFTGNVSASDVAFDLDWNGTGSVGLKGNIFTNCSFGSADYGLRIGFSGNGGINNQFYGCYFAANTIAGLVAWSASAVTNSVQGGGASENATAFWARNGQIISVNDAGMANNTQDFLIDSAYPMLIKGNRTESAVMCIQNHVNSCIVIEGTAGVASVNEFCRPKGKVIIDSCTTDGNANSGAGAFLCTSGSYTGIVYIRGCYFPGTSSTATPWTHFLTGFAGTVGQNI